MASVREVIIEIFNSIGYIHLTPCKDGAEAWEKIQNQDPPFDLIVSDCQMPNSSGLDLLLRIRSSEIFKSTPFLMISTVSEQENILGAIKAGADYYLVKPFKAPELAAKLKIIYDKRNGVKS